MGLRYGSAQGTATTATGRTELAPWHMSPPTRERLMFARLLPILSLTAGVASGQVPGAPVLQNAFHNPGLAVAVNFGSGTGQSFFGGAAAYGVGGRFQVSGAAGVQRANSSTRGAYGGRVAASLWSSSGGALGLGGFAGVGGATSTRINGVVSNAAVTNVPV